MGSLCESLRDFIEKKIWTYSTESPAWSTLPLIFNRCNNSFGSPIHWSQIGNVFALVEDVTNNCWFLDQTFIHILQKLLWSPVCELVDTCSMGWFSFLIKRIVLLYFLQIGFENFQPFLRFYWGSIWFSILFLKYQNSFEITIFSIIFPLFEKDFKIYFRNIDYFFTI